MRRLVVLLTAALLVTASTVAAQTPSEPYDGPPPPHVSVVDGTATLERDGRPETAPLNMPLLSGDRLRTADGRVEVLFGDGSTLHVDASTTVDLQGDDLLRLIDGRLRLNVVGGPFDSAQGGRQVSYRVDSPEGSVQISQPGEYRVALLHGRDETQLELAVIRGAADIFTDEGTSAVRAGERAYASAGLLPSYAYAFNSAQWDAFDSWSEARRDERLGASAEYLPADMRSYAPVFDEYGDWRYAQSYGYVWYPRVAPTWRPYYYGRWAAYPRYGWTWIGIDRFSWPTHHYGRWGFSAGAWFWIPASRWAPAYVSWAYAPGYVSWCPLGFDNRPVFSINVNIGSRYSPWGGWTVLSASNFGAGYVHQRAVNWERFDRGRRPAFQVRATPPAYRVASRGNVLPPSASAGASADRRSLGEGRLGGRSGPGGRDVAVPRDTAVPRYTNRGDEIIRSQTARPMPARPGGAVTPREVRPVPARPLSLPGYTVPQRSSPEGSGAPAYGRDRAYERTPAPRATPGAPGYPAAPPSRSPGSRGGAGDSPRMAPRATAPPARAPGAGERPAQPREYARPDYGGARPAPVPRGAPPSAAPAAPQGRPAPAERARPSGGVGQPQAAPRRGGGRGGR